MARYTKTCEVVSNTWGWEIGETEEHRYQPRRGEKIHIYSKESDYYTTSNSQPTWSGLKWERHPDQFWAEKFGTVLWIAADGSGNEDEKED